MGPDFSSNLSLKEEYYTLVINILCVTYLIVTSSKCLLFLKAAINMCMINVYYKIAIENSEKKDKIWRLKMFYTIFHIKIV